MAMEGRTIIYEQPLNEIIRVFLRLEYLFKQAKFFINNANEFGFRMAIDTILNILNVIDRPDLKGKLVNVLQLQHTTLQQFKHKSNYEVDTHKLDAILGQLEEALNNLYQTHGKLAQNLRNNEFLNQIRQKMNIPAGTCEFAMPVYHLWLKQPLESNRQELINWFSEFDQIRKITELLLELTRSSAGSTGKVAENGFYQEALSPDIPYQLIRVEVSQPNIYPEISVGRHRLSIYFLYLKNIEQRPTQVLNGVSFNLTCCRLFNSSISSESN